MKNVVLKDSLTEILSDPRNVIVKGGTISGYSIEVEYRDNRTSDSFCYYNRLEDRDSDLTKVIELLSEKDKQNQTKKD